MRCRFFVRFTYYILRYRPCATFKLFISHIGIDAAVSVKHIGCALLGDRAVCENYYLVSARNGSHSVGNYEDRIIFDKAG